jgi:tRNA dimethylallyltransferase
METGSRLARPTVGAACPLLLLAGPTAVGKSAVAFLLAERLGGEIISVDSMQVYRGLDIGTAKPSPAERQQVPHHLIDVVEVAEPFDAAQFAQLARQAVEDIGSRGRVPILCGGTGLYFKAFLEGVGEAPPANPELRAALERTPLPELLRELAARDPATFAQIDQLNLRRVVRALEVIRLTGKAFSVQRAPWGSRVSHPPVGSAALFLGLSRGREDLAACIDARVDSMFQRGLVAETESLLQRGLAQNRTAMQAIGYRQVVEHLRGQRSLPETIALVKQRTRQLAKRQMTWFRKHAPLTWIDVPPDTEVMSVAKQVIELWRQQAHGRSEGRSDSTHP